MRFCIYNIFLDKYDTGKLYHFVFCLGLFTVIHRPFKHFSNKKGFNVYNLLLLISRPMVKRPMVDLILYQLDFEKEHSPI